MIKQSFQENQKKKKTLQILNEYAHNRVLENMKQNLTELKGETIIASYLKALSQINLFGRTKQTNNQ